MSQFQSPSEKGGDLPPSSSSSGAQISTPSSSTPGSPSRSASPPRPSIAPVSYLQRYPEILLMIAAIYPITLVLGSLFSTLSPIGQKTGYFSRKTNIFNVLFVKNGWFWTTAAFFLHLFKLNSRGGSNGGGNAKAVGRWAVATGFWIFVTQWCFGPPLMDRTFTVTGGTCEPRALSPTGNIADELKLLYTSAACKVAGGRWNGGHDLSGHVFMLTHASLFLWAEVLPSIIAWRRISGTTSRAEWKGVHWFVWGIIGLWWWMLLMTAIYFHTWKERITGWIVSILEFGVLYIWALPNIAQARSIFGLPGF